MALKVETDFGSGGGSIRVSSVPLQGGKAS